MAGYYCPKVMCHNFGVRDEVGFCSECGCRLTAPPSNQASNQVCPKCKEQCRPSDKYCPHCGNVLRMKHLSVSI